MNIIVSPRLTLCNGDRMKQPEFHRRYEAYPEDMKFELVGGIVYMASPLGLPHSDYDEEVGFLLGLYRRATPGTQVLHGASTILDEENEPQPDLGLRILPDFGGQSRTTPDDMYVEGAPEWLGEIAHSSRAIDMNQKRVAYRQSGILEYMVLLVEEQELHWFDFQRGRLIRPNRDGFSQSRVFPGLWIDGAALLARDSKRTQEGLELGLASPEHARFVKRLERAHRRQS
jgi:Uma2 family endonuclease